jgi:hypothetical protein
MVEVSLSPALVVEDIAFSFRSENRHVLSPGIHRFETSYGENDLDLFCGTSSYRHHLFRRFTFNRNENVFLKLMCDGNAESIRCRIWDGNVATVVDSESCGGSVQPSGKVDVPAKAIEEKAAASGASTYRRGP